MKSKAFLYEALYFGLAVVSLLLAFHPRQEFQWLDYSIYGLYVLDYAVRLYQAQHKWAFIKRHPLDLIAILPVVSAVRIVRVFRLVKLLRLSSYFAQRFPKLSQVMSSNSVGLMLVWLVAIAMLVSIPLTLVEPAMRDYGDALWWTLVTTTTVGYGDVVPATLLGKIIGVGLMLGGIGIVSLITGNISQVLITKHDKQLSETSISLSKFEQLDKVAQQRIVKRLEEEIEFELYKQENK